MMNDDKVVMLIPLSGMYDLTDLEEILLNPRILVKFVTDEEFQIILNLGR